MARNDGRSPLFLDGKQNMEGIEETMRNPYVQLFDLITLAVIALVVFIASTLS